MLMEFWFGIQCQITTGPRNRNKSHMSISGHFESDSNQNQWGSTIRYMSQIMSHENELDIQSQTNVRAWNQINDSINAPVILNQTSPKINKLLPIAIYSMHIKFGFVIHVETIVEAMFQILCHRYFRWIVWTNCWTNCQVTDDLRHLNAHYNYNIIIIHAHGMKVTSSWTETVSVLCPNRY